MNILTLAAFLATNAHVAPIIAPILASEGKARFASFTYRNQQGELSRYNLQLGFSYGAVLEKSKVELEVLTQEDMLEIKTKNPDFTFALVMQAREEIMASINKSIGSFENGEVNPDYTKKDSYLSIAPGFKININDLTIQIFGLLNSKVVLEAVEYPRVNSRALTLAKKEIEKRLTKSKFREFALENLVGARINGEVFEFA